MTTTNSPTLKKYRLDNLFCADTGDFDIKKEHITGVGTDVVTAGETDNGILGKTDIQAKIFPGNTLTVDMFGNCVYRPDEYKLVTHSRVFSLKSQNQQFNEAIGLYMVAALKKLLRHFTYSNMCSWNKIKHFDISLPSTSAGEIDWAYMEQYISELEQQRIAELDQYLIVSGLNDCELTEEDKAVLAIEQTKQTKEFRLADLFYSEIGDVDIQKKDLNGKGFDVVSAGRTDCGFVGKTDRPSKNIFSHTLTVDMFGNTFYRNIPYKMVTHARIFALIPKFKMNELSGQYIISKLFFLPSIFSYGNMCSWSKIQNIPVLLPVKTDSFDIPIIDNKHTLHPQGYLPDWDFAEHYIKIIEKIVINDVTHWKDKEIQLTKYLSKTESKDNLL